MVPGVNTTTRETILSLLKRNESQSMDQIANALGITKMAVFKHMSRLEESGLVERVTARRSVGRPVSLFHLTESGKDHFRSSYASMMRSLIDYMVEKGQRSFLLDFMKERYAEIQKEYYANLGHGSLEERVQMLAKIRDREGYMAESRKDPSGHFELVEYNCPIYQIAQIMGEACDLENMLFRSVLDVTVESTHRQVSGERFCRFIVHQAEK